MTTSTPRWYLIHCKPRQDQRAIENLERQAFQCFQPTRPVERVRHGKKSAIAEPLFPGYLFIHLDENDNWHPISSTRGVNQVVRFNGKPLPVKDAIIEQLQAYVNGAVEREPYLKAGERVLITGGAFSQLEAIFVANDGDERVILLLNLLQSEQTLSFPIEDVRKLSGG